LLKDELKIEFEKRSFEELCACFSGLDACVEPVLSVAEAVEHPQLQARELVCQVPREDGSLQAQMACPLKFSDGLPEPRHIGATLGAHSEEVLTELGYGPDQIVALRKSGVIG